MITISNTALEFCLRSIWFGSDWWQSFRQTLGDTCRVKVLAAVTLNIRLHRAVCYIVVSVPFFVQIFRLLSVYRLYRVKI
jgi:uncharacterized RDD family membrane protein YckC